MDIRKILKMINVAELTYELNLPQLYSYDLSIGYDNCVYLLFCEHPKRKYSDIIYFKEKDYYVVKLNIDWYRETVIEKEIYFLKAVPYEIEYVRTLGEGFLIMGYTLTDLVQKVEEFEEEDFFDIEEFEKEDFLDTEEFEVVEECMDCILLDKSGNIIKKYEIPTYISDVQTSKDGHIFLKLDYNIVRYNQIKPIAIYDMEGNLEKLTFVS